MASDGKFCHVCFTIIKKKNHKALYRNSDLICKATLSVLVRNTNTLDIKIELGKRLKAGGSTRIL